MPGPPGIRRSRMLPNVRMFYSRILACRPAPLVFQRPMSVARFLAFGDGECHRNQRARQCPIKTSRRVWAIDEGAMAEGCWASGARTA